MASTTALAQTTPPANPVVAHFRAYRAALDLGDLPTAEQEATAALNASVARDGDGGSTATLAVNLAQVRLSLGRRADAYEPALTAVNIASSGNANVSPLLARLILGRTELTEARWRESNLLAAIEAARSTPDLNAETYIAASELGGWLYAQEALSESIAAWEIAIQMADASGDGGDYARAEARIGYAIALSTAEMIATIRSQARPTDTRLGRNNAEGLDRADSELQSAQGILGPAAFTVSEDGAPTLGHRLYGNVVAWRTLLEAFTESRGLRRPTPRSASFEMPWPHSAPRCRVETVMVQRPTFPPAASARFAAGAAVVRFTLDDTGQVTGNDVVAAIPDRWFREAVERVASSWRVERHPEATANCRFSPIEYQAVKFYFR